MTRRCSHCSHNGHNSRTCPNRGVKLFGVRLTDGSIRKSASMGNLNHYAASSNTGGTLVSVSAHQSGSPGDAPDHGPTADGYASEDFIAGSSSNHERKKGVPWTEEEHRMFLLGLQKLGKGDWRGISRNFVVSRTPTQVASHAQKYFIRQSNVSRRKRRSSLFDIVADEPADISMVAQDFMSVDQTAVESRNDYSVAAPPPPPPPPLHQSVSITPPQDDECESMDSTNSNDADFLPLNPDNSSSYPLVYPTYYSSFFPFTLPYWPGYPEPLKQEIHEVVKPTAVHSKTPINIDELIGISKLSLRESIGEAGPSSLSVKLLDGSSRQSAFRPKSTAADTGNNAIRAV